MFLPPCFSIKDLYPWLAISLLSCWGHRGTSKGLGWEAETEQEMVGRTLGVIWDSWRGRWGPSTSQQVSFSSLATYPQCPKAPAVSQAHLCTQHLSFLGKDLPQRGGRECWQWSHQLVSGPQGGLTWALQGPGARNATLILHLLGVGKYVCP